MQTGYYAAAAGMVTQFNRLNTIANNLANLNTAGYKQDNLVTGDFMRIYKNSRDNLPDGDNTQKASQFYNRTLTRVPQIVDSYTNQQLGAIEKTDNTFDFALSKEGAFFLVKTPGGLRLTRDGSFTTDSSGNLVTKQGYEVLGSDKKPIHFDLQNSTVVADKNGQFSVNVPQTESFVPGKTLFIAEPDNIRKLKKDGDNLYSYSDISSIKPDKTSNAVKQGFIEKSNVNAVTMMVKLIQANRMVGMYQKVMSAQMNDLNQDAINKLASTQA
jgi:flagellar basal-body rod protein FlgF